MQMNKPTNRVSPPGCPPVETPDVYMWFVAVDTDKIGQIAISLTIPLATCSSTPIRSADICLWSNIYILAVTNVPLRNWPVLQTEEEVV